MLNRTFRTTGYHGYNVKFSSFDSSKLACAASKNYGISGSGCLFILNEELQLVGIHHWAHGLYDLAWSESDENIIITGSADGKIQVWNVKRNHDELFSKEPIHILSGHNKEIYCLDWSQVRDQQLVVSGSWDCTAKIWDIHSQVSLLTFCGHSNIVYSVVWSYSIPHCFASASGDGNLRIWNTNSPMNPAVTIPAHSGEILSCDWSKYKHDVIVTSAVDGLIKGWDLRMPKKSIFQLSGHDYAVRRVKFSPYDEFTLASTSYDMTTKLWSLQNDFGIIFSSSIHTEFVYGLDFSVLSAGKFADCGWDEIVSVYSYEKMPQQ